MHISSIRMAAVSPGDGRNPSWPVDERALELFLFGISAVGHLY